MIDVIWVERSKDGDNRSRYGVCTMLNDMFDLYYCRHHTERPPEGCEGAVFVIQGGNMRDRIDSINQMAAPLRWAIFILMGDEECVFPSWELRHPRMRLWLQTPRVELTADRYYPCGYPNDALGMIAKHKSSEKEIDWFFAGQYTHDRRRACVAVLMDLSNGIVIPTQGFGQGLNHDTYFHHMCRARVVPCPSGPETPDTYRVYEALEAGAVPVVDAVSPKGGRGYWEKVFGEHPLPVITDWADFPVELDIILADWARKQKEVSTWWNSWKLNWNLSLAKDVERLRGPA